ncbi:MAG: radical SAM protein [Anaerolineaceae bacterium]|nr:radical SAM protein [Anaerolineaceae bacterium]
MSDPYFLGLLPTRGCNMACRYCDFLSGDVQVMSIDTVRRSVDAYLDLLCQQRKRTGAVHFFGGEPFHAPQPVQFAVEYTRLQAATAGIGIHFEATTNGNYDPRLARWIADNLDTVVLSLDGPAAAQDLHRPLRGGSPSFPRVTASADIFSAGDCELVLRTCVSQRNVDALPEIADWFARRFHPAGVCFEPLSLSESAHRNGLLPPDPLAYARQFHAAARRLEKDGIPAVLSTADLSRPRVTPCPVGNDALIVSPEGEINACYLLEKEWQAHGLDMTLGQVSPHGFLLDPSAVARVRRFSVYDRPLCTDCFCRFSCAGGCHVHHDTHRPAGQYDDQCIRTRLVTAALLLEELGQGELCAQWLADDHQLAQTAWQVSDRLLDPETSQ